MRSVPVIAVFAISFLLSSFTGCDTDPIHSEPPSPYPEYGAGDTARVHEGEKFEIVLYNNSNDAGYSWYISEEFDLEIVEFVKKYGVIVNPDLLGSPIYEHWRYRAASQGTTSTCYKLYQLWIGEDSAIDTAYATIIVN